MTDQNQDSTSTTEDTQLQAGAAMSDEKGAEDKEGQAGDKEETTQDAPRVYSEGEWNKRQSGFDKQMSKISDTVKDLEKSQLATTVKAEDTQYENWLQAIRDGDGDTDAAGKAIAGIKDARSRVREVLAREADITGKAAVLEEAGRGAKASELMKEHGLPETVREQLLNSENPLEMENQALKLAMEKKSIDATPKTKVDSGGDKGATRDIATLPTHEALGTMMNESLEDMKK